MTTFRPTFAMQCIDGDVMFEVMTNAAAENLTVLNEIRLIKTCSRSNGCRQRIVVHN